MNQNLIISVLEIIKKHPDVHIQKLLEITADKISANDFQGCYTYLGNKNFINRSIPTNAKITILGLEHLETLKNDKAKSTNDKKAERKILHNNAKLFGWKRKTFWIFFVFSIFGVGFSVYEFVIFTNCENKTYNEQIMFQTEDLLNQELNELEIMFKSNPFKFKDIDILVANLDLYISKLEAEENLYYEDFWQVISEIETKTNKHYFIPTIYGTDISGNVSFLNEIRTMQLYINEDLKLYVNQNDRTVNFSFFNYKYEGDTLRLLLSQVDTTIKPNIIINRIIKDNSNLIKNPIEPVIHYGNAILVGSEYKDIDYIEGIYCVQTIMGNNDTIKFNLKITKNE